MPEPTSYLCPTPQALSARIRAERARLGLSQREAAAILGLTKSSYRAHEDGKHLVRLPALFALVEALEMDPRALLPELFAAVDRKRAMRPAAS
jgi:transcriptional regulator with XRE-family HTH domain